MENDSTKIKKVVIKPHVQHVRCQKMGNLLRAGEWRLVSEDSVASVRDGYLIKVHGRGLGGFEIIIPVIDNFERVSEYSKSIAGAKFKVQEERMNYQVSIPLNNVNDFEDTLPFYKQIVDGLSLEYLKAESIEDIVILNDLPLNNDKLDLVLESELMKPKNVPSAFNNFIMAFGIATLVSVASVYLLHLLFNEAFIKYSYPFGFLFSFLGFAFFRKNSMFKNKRNKTNSLIDGAAIIYFYFFFFFTVVLLIFHLRDMEFNMNDIFHFYWKSFFSEKNINLHLVLGPSVLGTAFIKVKKSWDAYEMKKPIPITEEMLLKIDGAKGETKKALMVTFGSIGGLLLLLYIVSEYMAGK